MARGIYRSLPEGELKQMRTDVLDELGRRRRGEQLASSSIGGKGYGFSTMTQENLYTELEEINDALPADTTEAAASTGVTRTTADFSTWREL